MNNKEAIEKAELAIKYLKDFEEFARTQDKLIIEDNKLRLNQNKNVCLQIAENNIKYIKGE